MLLLVGCQRMVSCGVVVLDGWCHMHECVLVEGNEVSIDCDSWMFWCYMCSAMSMMVLDT